MRAITVQPGTPSSARLEEVDEPPTAQGDLLVEGLALGICGTDREIVRGDYGTAPAGRDRLILGHESLGRVIDSPTGSAFSPGDIVVGIVRRPDPVPCQCCAAGEWDMCRNGRYTERGIKQLDGYGAERYRLEHEFAVPVEGDLGRLGVLVEPTSVVAKAWEQIERIGSRACFTPGRVLVTGAGPIGLLAALLGGQRGLEVDVLDLAETGPKPDLARALGARYHCGPVSEVCPEADIVVEATGADEVVAEVLGCNAPGAIVCLTGVSAAGRRLDLDVAALNREMVLENDVVFGSVNANRRHYEAAVAALAQADRGWLESLITRTVPLDEWGSALESRAEDVKTVIEISSG